MKILQYQIRLFLTLVVFALPWAGTEAAEEFQKSGVIAKVGYDQFYLGAQQYRFAPGAKIISNVSKRQKFSDFKPGDHIYFEGIVLNSVNYVNVIYYQVLSPS